jgi:LysM repeat protein
MIVERSAPSVLAVASLLTIMPQTHPPAKITPITEMVHTDALIAHQQPASRIYTVRPGDTLFYIAQRLLGSAGRWSWIYAANRDKISDPNLIEVGWKLVIPYSAPNGSSPPAAQTLTSSQSEAEDGGGDSGGNSTSTSTSTSSVTAAPATGSSEAILQATAAQFGWTGAEWTALQQLESLEDSSYSATIANPSSGALGMAQALGHGMSGTAGSLGNEYGGYGLTDAEAQRANSGSAQYQALWMCNYIKDTYGTPSAAVQFHLANNWY